MNTLSGVLFFVAFLPYIWAIVRGDTVPSPVSWVIWAGVDTLTLFAMKKEKAATGQLTGAVIGAWTVFVLALLFGRPSMGSIEWVSIGGAALGMVLWAATGNAVAAIICAQLAIFVGAIPTFAGAYNNPAQEDPIAWSLWTLSCFCALIAIPKWDLANALQPLNFTAIELTMVFLVIVRPFIL